MRIVYIIVGFIGLGLGAVGAVVPFLPAFPFLMLAAFCFAKSSKRLNDWFVGTKLYQNNLKSFVSGKGMTVKTKVRIILIVTATFTFAYLMMGKSFVGRAILGTVWFFHLLFFIYGVKTIKQEA